MDETPKEFREKYRRMIMRKSGEERMMMGDSMFVAARTLVLASLDPALTEDEKRRELFLRFYGNDFSPDCKERILRWMTAKEYHEN
jgi:7-cyano-7-deazaguanine synthase in queuosine biosynthesis